MATLIESEARTAGETAGESVTDLIHRLAVEARDAQRALARMPAVDRERALVLAAEALRAAGPEVLAANARDMAAAQANGLSNALLDRLRLDQARF